jgi:hypothetical protein
MVRPHSERDLGRARAGCSENLRASNAAQPHRVVSERPAKNAWRYLAISGANRTLTLAVANINCNSTYWQPGIELTMRGARVAALPAINRLCAPGSERAIEQRWYPSTALDDLLEIEEGKINDTRLYRCLDRILPPKTKLERHWKERCGALFGAGFDVLLYDLTSTYAEGAAENNPMVRRGYSREHRPDCEQLAIALIVNNEGFPFSYETFGGNRSDVSTMETILRMVERKYGKARRIWVFDRGMVSEENLAAIRKRDGQYLTGTPRSQMKRFEEELLKEDWTQVRPEVEVKKVAIPGGEEFPTVWKPHCRVWRRPSSQAA